MTPEGKALMEAVSKGHLRLIRVLIDGGAHINSKDENMRTPLMLACMNNIRQTTNGEKIVKFILSQDADPNCVDSHGNTAIIFACLNFTSSKVIQMLLEHNAKSQLVNHDSDTALSLAIKINNTEAIILLLGYFSNNGISPSKMERRLLRSKFNSDDTNYVVSKLKLQSQEMESIQSNGNYCNDTETFSKISYSGSRSNPSVGNVNYFPIDNDSWNDSIYNPVNGITNNKIIQNMTVLSSESHNDDLIDKIGTTTLPKLQPTEHSMIYANKFRPRHNSNVDIDTLQCKLRKLTLYNDELPQSLPSKPSFIHNQELFQHSSSMNDQKIFNPHDKDSKSLLSVPDSKLRIRRRNTLPPLRSKKFND